MVWLSHKKYTSDYIASQFAEISMKVRRETRRMVYVATAAVSIMAVVQTLYLYELLSA